MYLVWVPFQSEMKKLGAISDNKINLGAILVICRKINSGAILVICRLF